MQKVKVESSTIRFHCSPRLLPLRNKHPISSKNTAICHNLTSPIKATPLSTSICSPQLTHQPRDVNNPTTNQHSNRPTIPPTLHEHSLRPLPHQQNRQQRMPLHPTMAEMISAGFTPRDLSEAFALARTEMARLRSLPPTPDGPDPCVTDVVLKWWYCEQGE